MPPKQVAAVAFIKMGRWDQRDSNAQLPDNSNESEQATAYRKRLNKYASHRMIG
jgi:hypothetical protein